MGAEAKAHSIFFAGFGGNMSNNNGDDTPLHTAAQPLTTCTDQQLAEAFIAGNPDALSELITRYEEYILNVILKSAAYEDAEDIRQEVWERIFCTKNFYDGQKAATFKTWLYRVTTNTTADHYRKKKKRVKETFFTDLLPDDSADGSFRYEDTEPDEALRPDELLLASEHSHTIKVCLAKVPEPYATALKLWGADNTLVEIGSILQQMGITEEKLTAQKVKGLLVTGERKFAKLLKQHGIEIQA